MALYHFKKCPRCIGGDLCEDWVAEDKRLVKETTCLQCGYSPTPETPAGLVHPGRLGGHRRGRTRKHSQDMEGQDATPNQ